MTRERVSVEVGWRCMRCLATKHYGQTKSTGRNKIIAVQRDLKLVCTSDNITNRMSCGKLCEQLLLKRLIKERVRG